MQTIMGAGAGFDKPARRLAEGGQGGSIGF
jgi:hypothetical protein